MPKRMGVLVGLVLVLAAFNPSLALAKPGGTDRPWKSSGTGTSVLNVATGTGTSEIAGHAAHLGKVTTTGTVTLTPTADPNTFTITGTGTFVAANGDRLFTTTAGTTTTTGPQVGATAELTFVNTITGGTGRFSDASGSFTTTGTSVIVSIVGTTVTTHQTLRSRGRISY